eukprot:351973-Chlamydomonas_euryale.AAC.2
MSMWKAHFCGVGPRRRCGWGRGDAGLAAAESRGLAGPLRRRGSTGFPVMFPCRRTWLGGGVAAAMPPLMNLRDSSCSVNSTAKPRPTAREHDRGTGQAAPSKRACKSATFCCCRSCVAAAPLALPARPNAP